MVGSNSHRSYGSKKGKRKVRECHNHKPQPFPDPKRKGKPTNLNKHKPNKRTKSTKISSLFPKRGNCNTKRTEKYKNKMTHGKTYNKSPRRINHKATKGKTNTGTTALEVYGIMKTCLYNFDPLKPHFYVVKLGFTGVYVIFLISAQKHRLWVLVRTASTRRF